MNYPAYPPQPGYQAPPAQPTAPVAPPQQYAPQYPQAPAAPAPTYGYPPQQYAPQGYPQPQQPPAPPLATGSLDDFYNQPTTGTGPGISWKDKAGNQRPVNSWYAGYVVRDVTNGDVQQQTNPQQIPQFYKDGRPKFQMKVPLKGVTGYDGAPDFTDGEATWYVRGQAREELQRAMAEAGDHTGVPKAGAFIVVVLVQRRPSGAGFQPANIVQVTYTLPAGATPQAAPQAPAAASSAPGVEQAAPPAAVEVPQAPPAWVAPPAAAAPPVAPPPVQQAPVPPAPQAPAFQPPVGAPVAQAPAPVPGAPVPPPTLDPTAQAILAGLTAPAPAPVG